MRTGGPGAPGPSAPAPAAAPPPPPLGATAWKPARAAILCRTKGAAGGAPRRKRKRTIERGAEAGLERPGGGGARPLAGRGGALRQVFAVAEGAMGARGGGGTRPADSWAQVTVQAPLGNLQGRGLHTSGGSLFGTPGL